MQGDQAAAASFHCRRLRHGLGFPVSHLRARSEMDSIANNHKGARCSRDTTRFNSLQTSAPGQPVKLAGGGDLGAKCHRSEFDIKQPREDQRRAYMFQHDGAAVSGATRICCTHFTHVPLDGVAGLPPDRDGTAPIFTASDRPDSTALALSNRE